MNHPLISRPNLPALLVGSGVFTILFWLSSVGLSTLINWWFYPAPLEGVLQKISSSWLWRLFGWGLYLVPGFLAGFVARRSGLMHGAIVGALTAPITALFIYAAGFGFSVQYSSLIYGLVVGVIWCSLAGILGELTSSRWWPW